MSKCISRAGEYSEHVLDGIGSDNEFVCSRCGVVDQDDLLDAVAAARAALEEAQAERDRAETQANMHAQDAIVAERERDEAQAANERLTGDLRGAYTALEEAGNEADAEAAEARRALVEAKDRYCKEYADHAITKTALVEAETRLRRVEALRAVSEAATPGSWTAYFGAHGDPRVVADMSRPLTTGIANVSSAPDDYGKADAEFIAAACNYVRAALAAVPTQPAPTTILRTDDKYAYGKHANGEGWRIRREGAVPEATAPMCEHGKTEPHDATASDKNFHPVSFWCPGPAPEGEQQ